MKTRILFLLAVLSVFTGYGQNIRMTTLTTTAGGTNNGHWRVTGGGLTAAGGAETTAGLTNSAGVLQNAGPLLQSGVHSTTGAGTNSAYELRSGVHLTTGAGTNSGYLRQDGVYLTTGAGTNSGYIRQDGVYLNAGAGTNSGYRSQTGVHLTSAAGTNNGYIQQDAPYLTTGGGTNQGPTATRQNAPLLINGGFSFVPSLIAAVGTVQQATNAYQWWTTNADFQVLFGGTPVEGSRGQFDIKNTAATDITVTWPVSWSISQAALITTFRAASNAITEVFWYYEGGSNRVRVATKEVVQNFLAPTAGQLVSFHDPNTLTNISAAAPGATELDDIADPSADGIVAQAGFRMAYTSTLNGGVVDTHTNSVADITTDNFMTEWAYRDNADVNAFFWKATHNAGATLSASLSSTAFQLNVASSNSSTALIAGAAGFGSTATFAGAVILQSANDPDVTVEGSLTWDANGDVLRGFDGANQVAVGRKIEAIHCTVVLPNDLADSERDAFWIWENVSGMNFIVTGWSAKSDTDDTTLNIEEVDNDGANNATVDAVEIATNGTGMFYASDTTITAATIENGHLIVLDFDDTDTPGQVKITIYGYYDANVN